MKGRILDFSMSFGGKQRITLELDTDFREGYEALKEVPVEISLRKWRRRRSNDANKYFHVLVNEIAAARGLSDEEVKRDLVVEYGTVARDDDGLRIAFKLPASVDVDSIYPYTRGRGKQQIIQVLSGVQADTRNGHQRNGPSDRRCGTGGKGTQYRYGYAGAAKLVGIRERRKIMSDGKRIILYVLRKLESIPNPGPGTQALLSEIRLADRVLEKTPSYCLDDILPAIFPLREDETEEGDNA